MKKIRPYIMIISLGVVFFVLAASCFLHKPQKFSANERRYLMAMPQFSLDNVINGSFMRNFETYTQDQFPFREQFRQYAAVFSYNVINKADNHDIYMVDGFQAKLDYPLNEKSVSDAASKFKYVYDKYLAETGDRCFYSIIPDKGYYLARNNNYPDMDYKRLIEIMNSEMTFAEYIDITDTLDIDCYYKTDPHWRAEKIENVAIKITNAMGIEAASDYASKKADVSYKGTYAGQMAIPVACEDMYYITNEAIENAVMINHESGSNTEKSIYNFEKLAGHDPYEMYLDGPVSLITVKNSLADNQEASGSARKLIVFRDSFGSSIIPYFINGYSQIVLVDIRYISPDFLGKLMEFEDSDVLFLYCTSVLNHSETIK